MLGVLAAGGYGAYRAYNQRKAKPQESPEWPPLPTQPAAKAPAAKQSAAAVSTADATPETQRWVAPVDGDCPDGYPLKANDNSGIFHIPGGRFYDRTVAERCYANADDAIADGYRPAKA
jgi:hypothetical protein